MTRSTADGESIVVAGVYRRSSVEQDATPSLALAPLVPSDLPRATRAEQKSEVVVVLMPTIVRRTSDVPHLVPPVDEHPRGFPFDLPFVPGRDLAFRQDYAP